jgi:hypothetical protein
MALPIACLAVPTAQAETITVELTFEEPALRPLDDASGSHLVETPGCVTFNAPGLPLLPAKEVVVLLPPGEQIAAVRVHAAGRAEIAGIHRIAHAQTPQPISATGPFPPTLPDAAVYESNAPYPPERSHLVTVQRAWGHDLAFLRAYPVEYQPQSGKLTWFEKLSLEIETAPRVDAAGEAFANLRRTPDVLERLRGMLVNPEDLSRYGLYENATSTAAAGSRLMSDYYPYVIITTAALEAAFSELVLLESSRGLRARTMLLSDITATYPGDDVPEQLRNFIIDAYQNWQTQFVLLGGDKGLIPVRNLYVETGGYTDHFPGDCYYEGLDGTWNDDGDGYWGEDNEHDLLGEVAVGRAPVQNTTELARWLHKNAMYTEQPVVSEIEKGLFVGERMDSVPTWGGDCMDEVKDFSCAHGYCTSGYPDSYLKETLYDRDGSWTKWDVIDLINDGFPSSHHLGHSFTTYNMKMSNGDVAYLTNDGVTHSYTLMYTQGCYANNFDANSSDAISEVFCYDDNGAAAFIGNTRYGWYSPGSTAGASQHFDREFVDACYEEGIIEAGPRHVDSKADCVWMLDSYMLWCHYELCLLGDPALPQWRELAGTLELAYAGDYLVGHGDCEVTVYSGGLPVEGATVTIYSDDLEVWASLATDANGIAVIDPDPSEPMTLHVKAVKPDYLLDEGDLNVISPETPWLVVRDLEIDDDDAGSSFGDGDGLVDVGETLELLLELRNVGLQEAQNVSLTLSCTDPRIAMIDSTAWYGTIGVDGTGYNLDEIVILITGAGQDEDLVTVHVDIVCDDRPICPDDFDLRLHAPVLSIAAWEIDDSQTGDGEGDMDPGEEFALHITLTNTGSDDARDLQALFGSESVYVEMLNAEAECPLIPVDGTEDLEPNFEVLLDLQTPTDLDITFDLCVTTWAEQVICLPLTIAVASFLEDYFEEESGWTAGVAGDDASDGIWVRVDPLGTWGSGIPIQPEDDHTPFGTHCFVTGQGEEGDTAMESDVDGGKTTLLSPVIDLSGTVQPRLIYWRWWTNNYGPFSGEDCWQVDISSDGGDTWVHLENTTDGINEWRRMEFSLEDYVALTANVVIRFVASDYTHDSLIEAAVDDIVIESLPDLGSVADPHPQARPSFGIRQLSPNPVSFSSASPGAASAMTIAYAVPLRGAVSLQLFDIDGSLVKTIAQGVRDQGEYRAAWNGRDTDGAPVASGIYFYRLKISGQESQAKLVVIK